MSKAGREYAQRQGPRGTWDPAHIAAFDAGLLRAASIVAARAEFHDAKENFRRSEVLREAEVEIRSEASNG